MVGPLIPHFTVEIIHDILDLIQLEDVFPIIMLVLLLAYFGGLMAPPGSPTYQRAKPAGGAVFLLYVGMGIYVWGCDSVTDLLLIVLRAWLASAVGFGMALIVLAPAAFLIRRIKAFVRVPTRPPTRMPEPPPMVQARDYAAEERAAKERMSKIDDARALAIQFYEEHAVLLEDSLPPALFKSQIRIRFPEAIKPDEAWQAAQGLITEMVPLIAKAREQQRADEEEARKRLEQSEELETKRKETEERRHAFQKLVEWYQREQETIKQSLPEGHDREDALRHLFERYDQLMKDTYAEMKP